MVSRWHESDSPSAGAWGQRVLVGERSQRRNVDRLSRGGECRLQQRAVEPFTPLPLRRAREPFDDPACVYELKYDGFRALLFLGPKRAELVSRNGNRFGRFADLAS